MFLETEDDDPPRVLGEDGLFPLFRGRFIIKFLWTGGVVGEPLTKCLLFCFVRRFFLWHLVMAAFSSLASTGMSGMCSAARGEWNFQTPAGSLARGFAIVRPDRLKRSLARARKPSPGLWQPK